MTFDASISTQVDERRIAMLIFLNRAPVAQLDRASGYETFLLHVYHVFSIR